MVKLTLLRPRRVSVRQETDWAHVVVWTPWRGENLCTCREPNAFSPVIELVIWSFCWERYPAQLLDVLYTSLIAFAHRRLAKVRAQFDLQNICSESRAADGLAESLAS